MTIVESKSVNSLIVNSIESVQSESVKSVRVIPTIMISVMITYKILILKWGRQIFTITDKGNCSYKGNYIVKHNYLLMYNQRAKCHKPRSQPIDA